MNFKFWSVSIVFFTIVGPFFPFPLIAIESGQFSKLPTAALAYPVALLFGFIPASVAGLLYAFVLTIAKKILTIYEVKWIYNPLIVGPLTGVVTGTIILLIVNNVPIFDDNLRNSRNMNMFWWPSFLTSLLFSPLFSELHKQHLGFYDIKET